MTCWPSSHHLNAVADTAPPLVGCLPAAQQNAWRRAWTASYTLKVCGTQPRAWEGFAFGTAEGMEVGAEHEAIPLAHRVGK